MKSLFRCLVMGILFFSCVGNESPDKQVEQDGKLTISLVPGYPASALDFWVIVHDLDGNPIAHQQISSGGAMTVELDNSKRYHLTTYMKTENVGYQTELFETYADLSVVEDITLGLVPMPSPNPTVNGTFQVDFLENELPYGAYLTSSSGGYNSEANHLGTRLEMTMNRFEGVSDYLLVAKLNTGETRYKKLKITEQGMKLAYKFSDLVDFDQVFKFKKSDFSQFYFTSTALNKVDGDFRPSYIVNSNKIGNSFDPQSEHEMGFLNGIEYFDIQISGRRSANSKTSFFYWRIGTLPNSITPPVETSIQVQSQTIADFRFNAPVGITNWSAVWDHSDPFTGEPFKSLRWFVNGSETSLKLSLPEEIVALNPKLQNLDDFRLESTEIITHSMSYDEQMRVKLVEPAKPQAMERSSIWQSFR